jgi:membrane associated rhomboid family serine protease
MKEELHKISQSLFFASAFLLLLWQVKLIETLLNIDLATFGILPREFSGFKGILTAPLIHADFNHLVSNSFSMCFLLACIIYIYNKVALKVMLGIYIISGVMVWLIARPVYHLGSSGLIYGLVSFLFFSGIFRLDVRLLTLSLLMVFMYGGLIWGVFPSSLGISWETHLMGSMSGVFYAFYYRNEEALPQIQTLNYVNQYSFDFDNYNDETASDKNKIISIYPSTENDHASINNEGGKEENREAA